jgi:transposase
MLSVEDWAEIRRLRRAEGLPIKVIARVLGISKNTVKVALASDQAPKYERRQAGSVVDEVEPRIRELLHPLFRQSRDKPDAPPKPAVVRERGLCGNVKAGG